MKKIMALFLPLVVVMGLTACSNTNEQPDVGGNAETVQTSGTAAAVQTQGDIITTDAAATAADTSVSESTGLSEENSVTAAAQNTEGEAVQTTPAEENTTAAKPAEETQSEESNAPKILVAYFSATGTTKGVAQTAAEVMGADIYEIVPETPYTSDDLNYNDNDSRSTKEMNDKSSRPAISGSVADMDQYDIVFIGYPIWWGDAPRIVSTFMESYDFSGKTVVPFCTSGGSGVGSSGKNLEALTSGADFKQGQRLAGRASRDEVVNWISGLNLGINVE